MVDFAWNMNNYDADLSLWKVLQTRYGLACAKELVLFAETYANLLRYAVELKNPMHIHRMVRNAESLQITLDQQLDSVTESLGVNHKLVTELKSKRDILKNQISDLLPKEANESKSIN